MCQPPLHVLYKGREALGEFECMADIPLDRLNAAHKARNPHYDAPYLVVLDTARLAREDR